MDWISSSIYVGSVFPPVYQNNSVSIYNILKPLYVFLEGAGRVCLRKGVRRGRICRAGDIPEPLLPVLHMIKKGTAEYECCYSSRPGDVSPISPNHHLFTSQ